MSWPVHPAQRSADPSSRRRADPAVVALALVAGILGGAIGAFAMGALDPDQERPSLVSTLPLASAAGGSGQRGSVTAIAQGALPSVVLITVGSETEGGVGSGFVIDTAGYIVTNLHVVQQAMDAQESVSVEFMDSAPLEAEIVGGDPAYDIAVLRVDRTGLPALELADSAQAQVGAPVVAVGAPLGLESTVTAGIVSALDRPVVAGDSETASFINAIQTDAAINPGNSGGPLLDATGRVIGVNSAIAQLPGQGGLGPGGSIGLGFAIPSAQVARTARSLIETGTSDHPVIGVFVDLAYSGEGARVQRESDAGTDPVVSGGPADEAGVEPGDVILAIDGERIADGSDLIVTLRAREIGEDVTLLVRSQDGKERTLTMTLRGASQ
ncbi:MAG: trypsin-like peptidase domain-containing protein [Ornithinimicrobium sp.]